MFFFSVRTVEFSTTLVCKRCHVAKAPFTVASVDAVVIGTVCCSTDVNRTQKNCQASKKRNVCSNIQRYYAGNKCM